MSSETFPLIAKFPISLAVAVSRLSARFNTYVPGDDELGGAGVVCDGNGDSVGSSRRMSLSQSLPVVGLQKSCASRTAIAPSPTADATRLTPSHPVLQR
jgi:hypothetical protein